MTMAMNSIKGLFQAGLPSAAGHAVQVPAVSIKHPSVSEALVDPASIHIDWTCFWTRWDGRPYSADYAPGYVEAGDSPPV